MLRLDKKKEKTLLASKNFFCVSRRKFRHLGRQTSQFIKRQIPKILIRGKMLLTLFRNNNNNNRRNLDVHPSISVSNNRNSNNNKTNNINNCCIGIDRAVTFNVTLATTVVFNHTTCTNTDITAFKNSFRITTNSNTGGFTNHKYFIPSTQAPIISLPPNYQVT